MRKIIITTPSDVRERTGVTRYMLVTNHQASFVAPEAVLIYAYMGDEEDGPSFTAWPFEDVTSALETLAAYGIPQDGWQKIPDQLPGCQDDRIAAVRIYENADGEKQHGRWQELVDGEWVEIEGPSGGYGLQIS